MNLRRILVIINHLEIGGIQKSLLGFLKQQAKEADITLLVFSKQGQLAQWLPHSVHVVETKSLYRYFGMAQQDCKTPKSKLIRTAMAMSARLFGTSAVCAIVDRTLDELGAFDEIISYHHPGRDKTIYGGTAQYALAYAKRHPARTTCFVHCDYRHSKLDDALSRKLYAAFDQIICVSQATKNSFLSAFRDAPSAEYREIEHKTRVCYNSIDTEMIHQWANAGEIPDMMKKASDHRLTLLSVARLSHEKGILRFVRILADINHSDIRYIVIGDGAERAAIQALIQEKQLQNTVFMVGEKLNPYLYMKHADLLVVPSYHEGAPIVFQEAEALSLPVFTTDTLSAHEMVKNGWIVENDDEAIRKKLEEVVATWNR